MQKGRMLLDGRMPRSKALRWERAGQRQEGLKHGEERDCKVRLERKARLECELWGIVVRISVFTLRRCESIGGFFNQKVN